MIHRYVLHNGRIVEASEKIFSAGQVGLLTGWGVFTTIRVVRGVPFAWERHWARMRQDAQLLRVPFPENGESVRADVGRLLEANGVDFGTLRLVVVRNRRGIWEGPGSEGEYDVVALTTDPKDWGKEARLMVVPQARHAAQIFSRVKSLSWAMNLCWNEMAASRGYDEALLLNEHGHVSECTSANVFIVKEGKVYTPPLTAGCLPGVTRDVLLHEIRVPGVEVEERDFGLEELLGAEEVFITSTTRNLLPVVEVEGKATGRNREVWPLLLKEFETYVEDYTRQQAVTWGGPRARQR